MTTTNKLLPVFDSLTEKPKATSIHKLMGAWVVFVFVSTWISSLLSPFALIWSIYSAQYAVTAFIVGVSAIAYLPWKKGSLCDTWQNFVCFAHYRLYRSTRILCEDKLPTTQKYPIFYAIHTHGAFCLGWSCIFHSPAFQKVRFCFAPALYASPFFRLFSRMTGNPGSASKPAMVSYMRKKLDMALPPGGFEEATLTDMHQDRVFIKKRTGFIKLCLQHGYHVRPVFTFGEKRTFWNIQGFWKLRLALNRMGLPAILVWGNPLFPIVPKNDLDMVVLIGKAIPLPQIDQPTREQVQEWHGKYIVALQELFENHKEMAYGKENGGKDCKLEVW